MSAVLPDSHTAIFTRVPRVVEKEWSLKTKNADTEEPVSGKSGRHAESLLASINLRVVFNRDILEDPDIIDESFDEKEDRIGVWQQVRREFADLETALAEAIATIRSNALDDARENGMKSIDLLDRSVTRVNRRVENYRTETPVSSSANSRPIVETVHPNESASRVSRRSVKPSGLFQHSDRLFYARRR